MRLHGRFSASPPRTVPPETEVEVLIPDRGTPLEEAFDRRLVDLGIIEPPDGATNVEVDHEPFTPIPNLGEPLSETIIRERR